jgi:YbgC/YbaW family acyl-CoA thioester hydrolase
MARMKIELPQFFSFEYTMPVRVTDINYGGHVGNDRYLVFMQEARVAWLAKYGYSELSFAGTGLIISQSFIEYKKELKYGDTIKIQLQATNPGKYGFDLYYCILLTSSDEPVIVAKACTTILCYDYTNKKLVCLPHSATAIF